LRCKISPSPSFSKREKTLLSKRRAGWIKKNRVEAIQHDFFIFIDKKIFRE